MALSTDPFQAAAAAAAALTNTVHVTHGRGKGERMSSFFQVLVKSKFSLLYFEEIMFVYVYSALKT